MTALLISLLALAIGWSLAGGVRTLLSLKRWRRHGRVAALSFERHQIPRSWVFLLAAGLAMHVAVGVLAPVIAPALIGWRAPLVALIGAVVGASVAPTGAAYAGKVTRG